MCIRDRSYGVDISEYAVSKAPKEVNGYVSCIEPGVSFGEYDWIICKDILEHIPYENISDQLEVLAQNCRAMMAMIPLGDGEKYFIDVKSLSEPYETKSVANSYNFVSENSCSLKAPKNFKVNLFAKNLDGPRNIKVASNGDVFVVESYTGNIKVLRDNDNDGKSDMEKIFAKGFNKPFGIDINNGFLYIADTDFVWKIPYIPGHLVQKSKAIKVTEPNALGDSSGHWTRNIAIKENKMYIAIGSLSLIHI